MRQALELALEALKTIDEAMPFPVAKLAQAAIKEALAQPEQEPVGQLLEDAFGRGQVMWFNKPKDESMLYTITAIKEALAQEQDGTYVYASSLATAIWQKHYMKESPKFALLDTIEGVITQIDNMTCGLVREKSAQPEQEPMAWMFQHEETGRTMCIDAQQLEWGFEKGNPRLKKIAPLYTTPPQRKPLTDVAIVRIYTEATGWLGCPSGIFNLVRAIEAVHGIKE